MLFLKEQHLQSDEMEFQRKEGKETERIVKTRVNQSFFRSTLLASYNNKCCITGISNPEFLIASHIVPWSIDSKNRLNPRNGILVNALHDKAFEFGFITINEDYKVIVCNDLLRKKDDINVNYFHKYHNQELILPSRFLPDVEFLKYHNHEKFRG
jgi:putative restriction endonuclease